MSHVALVSPTATVPARLPLRFGLWLSFCFCVVIPVVMVTGYLFTRAADQFASTVAFSVRTENVPVPLELMGGIADLGGSRSADADILFEFIRSQDMVRSVDLRLDLAGLWSAPVSDFFFAFDPEGTIEDLTAYWSRMVRVHHDTATGLIEVRALAFSSSDAEQIANAVVEESARLVDELSAIAQEDMTSFARAELTRSEARLRDARARLTAFRSRTQIVDPAADLQGQMGLLGSLEAQLAAALIEADLLRESTRAGDPRLRQTERRIAVIEARIDAERRKLGRGAGADDGTDYASILSEYEAIAVDREFAEESYRAAMLAFDQAQAEARRKSRYLAAHVRPTRAERAEFPRRFVLMLLTAFSATGLWLLGVLIYYSVRDRR